jgi:CHAD domain-containing protein
MTGQRKKIYKSLHKQGSEIRRTVSASAFFRAEDVHSFRTHVKKARAFLHWLGKDKKELPFSFREIYHISGELRDIQVLLRSMEDHPESASGTLRFTSWLRENALRLQQLWDDSFHPRIIRHLEHQLQRPDLKKPTAARMQSFFNTGVKKIEAVVYLPAPDDEELHEMRKKLKDMFYIYDWGKEHEFTNSDDGTPELLKKLGEDCGHFNDRRIGLLLLNAYIQQEKDDPARQAAIGLKQQWEEDRLERKSQLLASLRDFVAAY